MSGQRESVDGPGFSAGPQGFGGEVSAVQSGTGGHMYGSADQRSAVAGEVGSFRKERTVTYDEAVAASGNCWRSTTPGTGTTHDAVKFVDLPKDERGAKPDSLLCEFADALRDRPGEWAVWPRAVTLRSAQQLAWAIRARTARTPVAFQGGGFDAKSRGGVLYVRYVGEANE